MPSILPNENIKKWLVIGAGPAGIAAVGKLLDAGLNPMEIGWVDPAFKGGDLGEKWRPVSSNTKVGLFLKFLNACQSFHYSSCPIDFKINHLLPTSTCLLDDIADPLQWVTNELTRQVQAFKTTATRLKFHPAQWEIETRKGKIFAHNVILAIGAEPISLSLAGPPIISIEEMIDLEKLKQVCTKDDIVAVFGNSHTAIIALYNLVAIGAKVINFYRSPLKYAIYYDHGILFDNTGLKGYSAEWARQYIEGERPLNLERMSVTDNRFKECFATCTKVIYAVGFKRRESITISPPYNELKYNESTGVIGPRLFGLGFAFPQGKFDQIGNYEHNVGLWKFMSYLEEVLPIWLQPQERVSKL